MVAPCLARMPANPPDPSSKTDGPTEPSSDYGANALSAALTFAIAVALFTLGGVWLDGKCGTAPLFLVIGFLLGATGGMFHLIARLAPNALPFGRNRKSKRAP